MTPTFSSLRLFMALLSDPYFRLRTTRCFRRVSSELNSSFKTNSYSSTSSTGAGPFWKLINNIKEEMPILFKTAPKMIKSMSYPCETHKVRTDDGYVLTVHRIPHGQKKDQVRDSNRVPVLLQHGFTGSTDTWVLGGPGVSPGLSFVDAGYDVWIGNARGNLYSREHETLKTTDSDFWKFSWHEMGIYDLPAVIDYILKTTGHKKLFYVGHSMGNNMFYVLMSTKPEYNEKTKLQIALAPAVFLGGMRSSVAKFMIRQSELFKKLLNWKYTYEIIRPNELRLAFTYYACTRSAFLRTMCCTFTSKIVGQMDPKHIPDLPLYARMVGSTSSWTLLHLIQNAKSGQFRLFDYGLDENLQRYKRYDPPQYNLKKVIAPVVLYTSPGDDLVPVQGVQRLAQELPNVVEFYEVPQEMFNHLDFVMHNNLKQLLMKRLLENMAKFK